ncbi:NAD-dependent epimerase/dehydratase family protein [Pendulispora albinea]|uniref:NAD-dependent epimerase/dehydratase family protein n=1 Tax=Pendulispora albinea TaxID=2741071 RepID=A0ABZ2M3E3_9BACT
MQALDDRPPVVVTGATGFIAQHCIATLLARGHRVRGTVRRAASVESVRDVLAKHADVSRLEFAMADLDRDHGWTDALRGYRYVMHLASPLPARPPKHEDELIVPAREGTLRVLRAAHAVGVKRVVLTSSLSAVIFTKDRTARTHSEKDWSDDENLGAYDKSKTLAERAAWEFVLASRGAMELVAINPGLVLGPLLGGDPSASAEVVRRLLAREVPGSPRIGWAIADVRDVADAHVAAMFTPEAANQRFCCASGHAWMPDIARMLHQHFAPRGYRVPTRTLPDLVLRAMAFVDPSLRTVTHKLGRRVDVSTEKITRVLNWKPRSIHHAVIDMGESLIAHRLVSASV